MPAHPTHEAVKAIKDSVSPGSRRLSQIFEGSADRAPSISRLMPALLGWVLGTALQLQQVVLWSVSIYVSFVALGLIGYALSAIKKRALDRWTQGRISTGLMAVCVAVLAFGVTGWRAAEFSTTALPAALEGQDIRATGLISAMPQRSDVGLRFRFELESATVRGVPVALPSGLYLSWYAGGFRSPGHELDPSRNGPTLVPALRAGERWQVTLRLKAPHGGANPHGFDFELWMWEQGLQASGYVRAGPNDEPPKLLGATAWHPVERARQHVRDAIFARLARATPDGSTGMLSAQPAGAAKDTTASYSLDPSEPVTPSSFGQQLREQARRAGVIAGLVVGDQSAIERADWDIFRATGVAHLMSISGLHITMFAWAASGLIGICWRRSARLCLALPAPSAGLVGGVLLATAYAVFSGWGVPSQRTICMLVTVGILRWRGQRWPWPVVWMLACAVVVAMDPWALLQAGFWLSFVAVGVLFATDSGARKHDEIIAAGPSSDSGVQRDDNAAHAVASVGAGFSEEPLPRFAQRGAAKNATPSGLSAAAPSLPAQAWTARRASDSGAGTSSAAHAVASVGAMFREQWIVTVALTPLTLLLFGQMSLVSLLANALAIPWVTLIVTPLAMGGVLWSPLWDLASLAVQVLGWFLAWLASWPMATLALSQAPVWAGAAGVIGGALAVMRLPWSHRALGLPLLLPVLFWQAPRPAPGQFELLAADIGQGNAVLVQTATHALVFDAGPRYSLESDAGQRVLVPLLRALNVRIDTLMLSHRDVDHVGGASAVLGAHQDAQLLSSIEADNPLRRNRPGLRCMAGQHWQWDGVDFDVLHPRWPRITRWPSNPTL